MPQEANVVKAVFSKPCTKGGLRVIAGVFGEWMITGMGKEQMIMIGTLSYRAGG